VADKRREDPGGENERTAGDRPRGECNRGLAGELARSHFAVLLRARGGPRESGARNLQEGSSKGDSILQAEGQIALRHGWRQMWSLMNLEVEVKCSAIHHRRLSSLIR